MDKKSIMALILGTALSGAVSAENKESNAKSDSKDDKKCEQMKCGAGKCGSMKADPDCKHSKAEETYNSENFKKSENSQKTDFQKFNKSGK
ncbi:MAG: hypothetical protein OEV78_09985 [Spirochaetia bacterium]|nr:hypothetical protein [Spirochaetia bacterium]